MTAQDVAPHLGQFLRARRALVQPGSHGIAGGTRRTPGLRREEVATLAGVSTDYYIRLEQGREKHPSRQVLDALARALLLGDDAAAYLHGLATGSTSRQRRSGDAETAAEGLVALLDSWPDTPALLYGRYMDLLATNALGAALFAWIGDETNLLRAIFLRPQARRFYQDWAMIAEGCVAALRAENGDPDDPGLAELVAALSAASPDFARLWTRQDVRAKTATVKRLDHPVVGPLSLRFENLTVADAPGQHLVVYHADPDSREERELDRLRTACPGTARR